MMMTTKQKKDLPKLVARVDSVDIESSPSASPTTGILENAVGGVSGGTHHLDVVDQVASPSGAGRPWGAGDLDDR